MARIDVLAHVSEESRLRINIELKVEVKEELQASGGCLVTRIEALKSSVNYLGSNNFIFHQDTVVVSISVPEDIVVPPPPPSTDALS